MLDQVQLVSYAQNREDVILKAFFDDNEVGFYVDVGANHPVHESVTKLFYDKGWQGMNIEPTSRLYELLVLTRPRDINVQVGVSDQVSTLQFREYVNGDGLSTFSTEMQKGYEKDDYHFAREYREYQVDVTTLENIFNEYAVTKIDFMKVDVEGYEYEVLAGNNWEKFRPSVLCIEANHVVNDWHPLIKKAGYELIFFDGLNEYFVADEATDVKARFSYPDRVLLGEPFVTRKQFLENQDAQRKIRSLEHELHVVKASSQQPDEGHEQAGGSLQRTKHQIQRIDRSLEFRLTTPRVTTVSSKVEDEAVTTSESLVVELRAQIGQTLTTPSLAKRTAHKGYRSVKRVVKQVARKARK
jgi:FkbM family methyltransferase